MKELNLDDYELELQNEDNEKIYNDLVEKSINISRKVAKLKNIELTQLDNLEDVLSDIQYRFTKESGYFRDVIYLMKDLLEWNNEDYVEEIGIDLEDIFDDFEEENKNQSVETVNSNYYIRSLKDKTVDCIRRYNSIVFELNKYNELENEINKKGYEELLNSKKEKITNLFKEMLDYKNKKYDDNISFRDLADKISQYYNNYHELIYDLISAVLWQTVSYDVEEDSIDLNEIEVLMTIDDIYNILIDDVCGYKTEADTYRDFELEEGETFKDLFYREKEKFKNLFKEMLEYRNIKYTDQDSFDILKMKVMDNYPYYYVMLFHLISPNPNVTYIQELNSMEDVYERIISEYKNHEENMIKYKDYMELIRKEGYDIDKKLIDEE